MASKFLQFTNYHICVEATGKRVNRGVELGLKIAVNYFLYRDARGVKNSSEKLDNETCQSVVTCQIKHACVFCFPN